MSVAGRHCRRRILSLCGIADATDVCGARHRAGAVYLACGLLLTSPATVAFAMPLIFVGGALIGLSNTMRCGFAAFINGTIRYVVCIGIGAASLGLLRPLGADCAVQRLIRGLLRELAHISGSVTMELRSAFESRVFDRINALFMRLDPIVADQRAVLQGWLVGLRIGLNILVLRSLRAALTPKAASSVPDALTAGRLGVFSLKLAGRITQASFEERAIDLVADKPR
jgi:uncharacterized membrane protein YccC